MTQLYRPSYCQPVTNPRERWPDLLARAMADAGYDGARLAAELGVSRAATNAWRRGRYAPRATHQARIADLLGVPARDLFPLDEVAA